MVTTPTPPSFEVYYNTSTPTVNENQSDGKVMTAAILTGLALVSALTIYFALQNIKLKKVVKKIAPELDIN